MEVGILLSVFSVVGICLGAILWKGLSAIHKEIMLHHERTQDLYNRLDILLSAHQKALDQAHLLMEVQTRQQDVASQIQNLALAEIEKNQEAIGNA